MIVLRGKMLKTILIMRVFLYLMMFTWNVLFVWPPEVYYNKLIKEGEEEQLAKDRTNKWAVVSNKDIKGKFLCWFSFLLL